MEKRGKDMISDSSINMSQFLWKTLITSVGIDELCFLAKQYENINYIKESIYLLECYNRRTFPSKATPEEIEKMYCLHERLEPHLEKCQ